MDPNSNAATEVSIDAICSPENNNPTGVGEPMKEDDARTALLNYLQDAPMSREDKRHIFGYTFGLDKIKDFIKTIDDHNNKPETPDDSKIAGIRIYHAKTVRSNPVPPLVGGVMYRDLIIVPVLPSGKDYYTKVLPDKVDGDVDMILGDSRPCPNECKLDFLQKDKK